MIPNFVTVKGALWPLLPEGIHEATVKELRLRFAITDIRFKQFEGLEKGMINLFNAGCPQIFLDGSYVTGKPYPNDYEVAWDARFVNPKLLDPVFLNLKNGTADQKRKYLGEYFPSTTIEGGSGKPFLEFFQTDKDSGQRKGIIKVTNYLKQ